MWPPQTGTHLKITCSFQTLSVICWLTLFNFIDLTWVFTPWGRTATSKNLSFLCHSLDQSSFFLLQAVISGWLVTPMEDETVCMALILTCSQVSGPGVMGFWKMFFIKALFKILPLPEKLHLTHHQVPLRMCKLLLTTGKPQHGQRIGKWVFQRKWESPNWDHTGKRFICTRMFHMASSILQRGSQQCKIHVCFHLSSSFYLYLISSQSVELN